MKLFAIILFITLTVFAVGGGFLFGVFPMGHQHEYGEWQTRTPATCTEAGLEFRACECGESEETRELPATGHSHEAVVTNPTCTEGGFTTYTCTCGNEYVADEISAIGHNMTAMSDYTHHWTACANNCGTETEKVAHSASSISAVFDGSAMEGLTAKAEDFTVTATCTCGKEFAIIEGITVENGTLALGDNTVTVSVGEVSVDVNINAAPFSVTVSGTVAEDTYVYSGNGYKDRNYSTATDLSTNGDGQFRVLFRYNFTNVINNQFYNDYKGEATVQFTFTLTTGEIDDTTRITFKAYPVNELRSGVSFTELNWTNYDAIYSFGWGKADGFVNKEAGSPYVSIDGDKITITLTYREIEQYIDENGNALFVFALWKSGTKVGSSENETEANRPTVSVIFDNNHTHAYTEQMADSKYLISANCEEKAVYYVSCTCGETGTKTFEYGETIEHVFGEWETGTLATCLEAEVEYRACHCGKEETQTGDAALGHNMVTKYDITNHWTECDRDGCDEATEPVAHFGGTATETEQAVCEGCNQPYGGLATHEHSYSEWETRTHATCESAEVLVRTCSCGNEEISEGAAALGHSMVTKYDENNHWTECEHNCGNVTESVAHSGGEATETEQAVCEGCGQPYGELKEAEKVETSIAGAIVEDTYAASNSSSAKSTDNSEKDAIGTYSTYYRAFFKFDFSNIINHNDFGASKDNAKVKFVFALSKGEVVDTTKFTFGGFAPGAGTTDVAFSEVYWNNLTNDAIHYSLNWGNANNILDGDLLGDKVSYADGIVTFTFDYNEIASFIDPDTGYAVFTLRIGGTSGISIASMENTEYAIPTAEYVYFQ